MSYVENAALFKNKNIRSQENVWCVGSYILEGENRVQKYVGTKYYVEILTVVAKHNGINIATRAYIWIRLGSSD